MPLLELARRVLDVRKLNLPPSLPVAKLDVHDYLDASGKDAWRVDVTIRDGTDIESVPGEDILALKEAIHDALVAAGTEHFPYVRIATQSEWQQERDTRG